MAYSGLDAAEEPIVPSFTTLKRELILIAALLAAGLVLLPPAVYWVGIQVVGPYESEAGLPGLIGHVWSDFFSLEPGAWLLVWSPYLIVQLVRIAWTVRRRRDVTHVTDSHSGA